MPRVVIFAETCISTGIEDNPWVQVDLLQDYQIEALKILRGIITQIIVIWSLHVLSVR